MKPWSVIVIGGGILGTSVAYWLSEHVRSFVDKPHEAIVGEKIRQLALDMTSQDSEGCRNVSLDLVKEGVGRVKTDLLSLRPKNQRALTEWLPEFKDRSPVLQTLSMPRKIDWDAVKRAYEFQPSNYEELLSTEGIGPGAIRALALISEIIYGARPSWRDPVKYSFALGGKDGVPFPVDRRSYDEATQFIRSLIDKTKLEGREKYGALERLKSMTTV